MKKWVSLLIVMLFLMVSVAGCQSASNITTNDDNVIVRPTSTQNAYTTTAPTSTAAHKSAEIRIAQSMTVIQWGTHPLRFSYSLSQEICQAGDKITATVQVTSLALGGFEIIGTPYSQFGSIAYLHAENGSYTIASSEQPLNDDRTVTEFASGESVEISYVFTVPDDAPDGTYFLEVGGFGHNVCFDTNTAEENRNVMVCGDLPEELLFVMWGGDLPDQISQSWYQKYCKYRYGLFVYGAFDHVYVYFDELGFSNGMTYTVTVNGLSFECRNGHSIKVYSREKGYLSLAEAFETGVLSAEQLQIIHDNLTYVNRQRYSE